MDNDSVYDIWPIPEKLLNVNKSSDDLNSTNEFFFAIQENLVINYNSKGFFFWN